MTRVIEREFPDGTRIVSVEHPDGATVVGLQVEGVTVSRIYIVPMLMRIGAAVVRMDGIGGVATDEEHQKRGYARRVMEVAVEKMRAGDAALSTLYGIPDFYPKFGYATTGPEYTVTLDLPEDRTAIPSLPRGWTSRPFQADDLPAVQRIYDANTRLATGPLVRHEVEGVGELEANKRLARTSPAAARIGRRAWTRLLEVASDPGDDGCRVLLNASGEIVAYAWIGGGRWWIDFRRRDVPDSFHLGEVMAIDPAAADAALIACVTWAAESGKDVERIEMTLPPEGPVASAAAYAGGQFLAAHTHRGQFMGRALDVGRLFSQLQPTFSASVRAARQQFVATLTVSTDEGDGALHITPDGVTVATASDGAQFCVELPQETLARLCLGAFDTDDLLARLPTAPQAEAVALVKVLFPRRFPHVYPVDRC